jgi:tetratricopeptide (TPR) repeat protein
MKNKGILILSSVAILALTGLGTGCQQLRARDELNRGVKAYKSADYETAVRHFQEAVNLDPTFSTSRLYLATAYMSQYIPGASSEENMRMAEAAEREFKKVLEQDPKNTIAIESLASLYYNQATGVTELKDKLAKLDIAKEWYQKLIEVEPTKKEGHYSLGVISFLKYYPAVGKARNDLGMRPEDLGPLKDKKLREQLRTEYKPIVDSGISSLQKSVEIDPEYDDAMAYLNLLHRHSGALAESEQEYKQEIAAADKWLDKALDTKKTKAERASKTGGIVMEGGQ